MSTRLVPVLLLTAMLYALGAGVVSLARQPVSKPSFAVAESPSTANIPVLPTITVHPDALGTLVPATTLLPTVTVRPTTEEIAAAHALDERAIGTGVVVVALHAMGGGLAPRSGLDMPYYAFGKSTYRLRKE